MRAQGVRRHWGRGDPRWRKLNATHGNPPLASLRGRAYPRTSVLRRSVSLLSQWTAQAVERAKLQAKKTRAAMEQLADVVEAVRLVARLADGPHITDAGHPVHPDNLPRRHAAVNILLRQATGVLIARQERASRSLWFLVDELDLDR